ncbi:hypothetical protein [Candidatus Poriferisodalis sp.]|uniref:hypothetical protein n=1 Tax=Candidatus Poriferisodalis sp. TaxID=3101277 RepID=UPI003B01BF8A
MTVTVAAPGWGVRAVSARPQTATVAAAVVNSTVRVKAPVARAAPVVTSIVQRPVRRVRPRMRLSRPSGPESSSEPTTAPRAADRPHAAPPTPRPQA